MDKTIDTYLSEIGREALLTDAEERRLAAEIHQGSTAALNRLTEANLTFVVSLASQYRDRGLALDDLISEGNIGMLKAARRFDGREGKRFVTFAAPYIREAIEQAIEQQAGLYRVPRDVMDAAAEKQRSRALSIDAPVGGSAELSLGRVIADPSAPDPDSLLSDSLVLDELQRLMDRLPERDRTVVQRFYGIGVTHRTMAEIAQGLGLKRERVRQIRDHAVRRLCRLTTNSDLKSFLRK